MKVLFSFVFFFCITNIAYCANDWIPYEVRPSVPQIYVPSIPSVTYSTSEIWIQRPHILSYDWVPYHTYKTIVIERQGLLCKYRTTITQPTIEWIYQPVWR